MVLLQRKLYFSKNRGGPTFLGGGGGVQGPSVNFYRNSYNLWFSGGGPDPLPPPLDPQMVSLPDNSTSLHV